MGQVRWQPGVVQVLLGLKFSRTLLGTRCALN